MNGRFPKQLFLLIVLIVGSLGCSGGASNPGPTPTVDPVQAMQAAIQATMAAEAGNRGELLATWAEELEAAEKTWQEQGIHRYTIVVAYTSSHTVNQSIYTLTVDNGEIVEDSATCVAFGTNSNCVIDDIDLTALTVPGLFATARNALNSDTINDTSGGFNFHETYGVPQFIGLRSTGQFPWFWQVNTFEVLE